MKFAIRPQRTFKCKMVTESCTQLPLTAHSARCSKNPVIMRFDGRVVPREVGDPVSSRIHLVSVCGIDFASRVHDHVDLTNYIKNWKEVYTFDDSWMSCETHFSAHACQAAVYAENDLACVQDEGVPYVRHGRDFEAAKKWCLHARHLNVCVITVSVAALWDLRAAQCLQNALRFDACQRGLSLVCSRKMVCGVGGNGRFGRGFDAFPTRTTKVKFFLHS